MTKRWSLAEKQEIKDKIVQTLTNYPDGLGVRELRSKSGIGSYETLYKYLPELIREGKISFHQEKVGRGKPKKVLRLSRKGIAHLVEFKVIDYFERVRQTCKKNEQFELDNYAFSYAIYGMPKNLNEEEKKQATLILRKVNSALLELDEFRNQITNKEAYKYRAQVSRIHSKIFQSFSEGDKARKTIVIDNELEKEIWSYIPSSVREKIRLDENEDFAIVVTRGPSFIDEISLRPENHLLWLIQSVERWDEEGLDFVIKQLAKNKYVDIEAIDRIKKWGIPDGKISNYDWQKIIERLDDLPKIREEMQREKEHFILSGDFKRVLGIDERRSIVITKDMLGKEKMDEIKKELSNLK